MVRILGAMKKKYWRTITTEEEEQDYFYNMIDALDLKRDLRKILGGKKNSKLNCFCVIFVWRRGGGGETAQQIYQAGVPCGKKHDPGPGRYSGTVPWVGGQKVHWEKVYRCFLSPKHGELLAPVLASGRHDVLLLC